MCELQWGDHEEDTVAFDENEEGSESDESDLNADIEEENLSSDSLADMSSPSSTEGRNRRPPIWMRDYTTGEGFSEDDNEAHLTIHAGTDPIHFEDALKSEKWSHAMDLEMEAINKNGTWELKKLPNEGKKVGVKWIYYKTKFNENGDVDKQD